MLTSIQHLIHLTGATTARELPTRWCKCCCTATVVFQLAHLSVMGSLACQSKAKRKGVFVSMQQLVVQPVMPGVNPKHPFKHTVPADPA